MDDKSKDATRELIIDYGEGESFVDIAPSDTLADVRRLINEDFDDDMLPKDDWIFWWNGLRITQKQERRKIAWNYLPETKEGKEACQKHTFQMRCKAAGTPKRRNSFSERASRGKEDGPESKRCEMESIAHSAYATPSIKCQEKSSEKYFDDAGPTVLEEFEKIAIENEGKLSKEHGEKDKLEEFQISEKESDVGKNKSSATNSAIENNACCAAIVPRNELISSFDLNEGANVSDEMDLSDEDYASAASKGPILLSSSGKGGKNNSKDDINASQMHVENQVHVNVRDNGAVNYVVPSAQETFVGLSSGTDYDPREIEGALSLTKSRNFDVENRIETGLGQIMLESSSHEPVNVLPQQNGEFAQCSGGKDTPDLKSALSSDESVHDKNGRKKLKRAARAKSRESFAFIPEMPEPKRKKKKVSLSSPSATGTFSAQSNSTAKRLACERRNKNIDPDKPLRHTTAIHNHIRNTVVYDEQNASYPCSVDRKEFGKQLKLLFAALPDDERRKYEGLAANDNKTCEKEMVVCNTKKEGRVSPIDVRNGHTNTVTNEVGNECHISERETTQKDLVKDDNAHKHSTRRKRAMSAGMVSCENKASDHVSDLTEQNHARLSTERIEEFLVEKENRSSCDSDWHAMFDKLKCQPIKTKPTNEISKDDKILAKCGENDERVSLLTNVHCANWVRYQRGRKNRKKMSQEEIDLLNGVNFIWKPQEHKWNIRLNELREFNKKNGHFLVPRACNLFPKLRSWVDEVLKRKRNQEKETPLPCPAFLTAKQIADLDNMNFTWDPTEGKWLEKFNELKEFYKKNDHTHVRHSNCDDEVLVRWVITQRQHCDIRKRRKLLDSIEFVWSPLEL